MRRKITAIMMIAAMLMMVCTGCEKGKTSVGNQEAEESDLAVEGVGKDGIQITLKDNKIMVDSSQVTVSENVVTITASGTYVLTGKLSDGRIVVDAGKEDDVELVLNGVDITCSNYAPIQILQAGDTTIELAEESENILTDGTAYELADDEDNTDAVIFSKDDLKLDGKGTLTIHANYKHGIVCKDDLEIKGGIYNIYAEEDGINANDSITVDDGVITISAGDDGMHVDEQFIINKGEITVTESYEGLEGHSVIINNGIINIKASDDGINSNSGSDSEAGNEESVQNPMQENIPEMPQGEEPQSSKMPGEEAGELMPEMQSEEIGGMTSEMPEDRGNGGRIPDMSNENNRGAMPETLGEEEKISMPDQPRDRTQGAMAGTGMPGAGGRGMMDTDADSLIEINGGIITVDADGDGLDSNGYLTVNGGELYISGASNDGNSAIDYGIEATINGGILIATGYSGMAESFNSTSKQYCLLHKTQAIAEGGTEVVVKNSAGAELIRWTPEKDFNCILVSTPEMDSNIEYTVELDGVEDTI